MSSRLIPMNRDATANATGCGKAQHPAIPSAARNLSFLYFLALAIEERFLAALGMTE